MDVPPTRHSLAGDSAGDSRQPQPKCCPFCLRETLVTSWDSVVRCTRYQCCSCFEVFGRLSGDDGADSQASGQVVDFRLYRQARSSAERG